MMNLDKVTKIISFLFIIYINYGCSQTIKSGNMKWLSKYSFYDLYNKDTNNGNFPPSTGLKLTIFKFLNDKTIFIAGNKDLNSFYNKTGKLGVLFVSNDKGVSFKEITFPEENVTSLSIADNYTLIETNTGGFSPIGKNVIYLFDNMNLTYKKIEEYSSNSKNNYTQFNGEYVIHSKGNQNFIYNILTKENLALPEEITKKNYILSDKGAKITFLKDGNKIIVYDTINKTYKILKELKNTYNTIMNTFGEVCLGKSNLLRTSGIVYNIEEKELFTISPKEEKGLYRYKNFACYFIETRPYVTLRYSYDYGKTWYEYHTKEFFTTSTPKGFYQDKYMVSSVTFYDRKNFTDIMIGEFTK